MLLSICEQRIYLAWDKTACVRGVNLVILADNILIKMIAFLITIFGVVKPSLEATEYQPLITNTTTAICAFCALIALAITSFKH